MCAFMQICKPGCVMFLDAAWTSRGSDVTVQCDCLLIHFLVPLQGIHWAGVDEHLSVLSFHITGLYRLSQKVYSGGVRSDYTKIQRDCKVYFNSLHIKLKYTVI